MTARVLANIALVRLGLRELLPVDAIRRITINDCGEPLVSLPQQEFFFCHSLSLPQFARKTVVDKLLEINEKLGKNGISLYIYEAYRSADKQKKMHDDEKCKLYALYPEKSEAEIEALASNRVANTGSTSMGGHQTGGAVDITLCNKRGKLLDMGTEYLKFTSQTRTKTRIVNSEIKKNRQMLLSCMKEAGFVNYPEEWWHYSYGDALWAAYSREKKAFYSTI